MKFTNPCKICITRPMCKKTCKEFADYRNFIHSFTFLVFILIVFMFLIGLVVGLVKIVDITYIITFCIPIITIGYYLSIKLILEDATFNDEFNIWQRSIFWVLGPFLMLSARLFVVDTIIDNIIYKYIKHLQKNPNQI